MSCTERDVKQVLRRAALLDAFTLARYGFSPYMACAHNCAYCDGRAEKYYIEGDFGSDIIVRRNLPELLERELIRAVEPGLVSIGSGVSDPYQPAEERYGLMRKAAGMLAATDLPVSLMTKSALALRDLDFWIQVYRRGGFLLLVSLTTLDDSQRAGFEPGASSVRERLDMISAFAAAGIPVGVLMMPLLPGISDEGGQVEALTRELRSRGVRFVIPGALTLRPGRQKDYYLARIRERRPDLEPLYGRLYAENRQSGAPIAAYRRDFMRMVLKILAREELPGLTPHALYRKWMPLYDSVHVLLMHMQELYAARGVDTRPLAHSLKRYQEWLITERKQFIRGRRADTDGLTSAMLYNLDGIISNERLAGFIRSVAAGGILDYLRCELVSEK